MHIAPHDNQNQPIVDVDDAHVPLVYFNIVKLKKGEAFEYRGRAMKPASCRPPARLRAGKVGDPPQGFGVQRVYTEDGALDESIAVQEGDVVLVPRGHHPAGVPYGYEMYYLNVMAGPLRKWRFKNDPAHDWIYQRDLKG